MEGSRPTPYVVGRLVPITSLILSDRSQILKKVGTNLQPGVASPERNLKHEYKHDYKRFY